MKKADLEAEVTQLQQTKERLQKEVEQLRLQLVQEKEDWTKLATQDNALIHLLNDMLQVKVWTVPPRPKQHSNEPIIWGFFDGDRELTRSTSLAEGYRTVWKQQRSNV